MDFLSSELPSTIELPPHLAQANHRRGERATSSLGSGVAAHGLLGRLAQTLSARRKDALTTAERAETARLRRPNERPGCHGDLDDDESAWVPTRPMLTDL